MVYAEIERIRRAAKKVEVGNATVFSCGHIEIVVLQQPGAREDQAVINRLFFFPVVAAAVAAHRSFLVFIRESFGQLYEKSRDVPQVILLAFTVS